MIYYFSSFLEYGSYGPWASWAQESSNNVDILARNRSCLSEMCSGESRETKPCTPGLCKGEM